MAPLSELYLPAKFQFSRPNSFRDVSGCTENRKHPHFGRQDPTPAMIAVSAQRAYRKLSLYFCLSDSQ